MNKNTLLYKTYESLKNLSSTNKRLSQAVKHSDELLDILVREISFLYSTCTLSERLYCYINELDNVPRCPYCGKPRKYRGKIDKGYFRTCGDDECKKLGMIAGAKNRTHEKRVEAAAKGKETYFNKTGYYNNMQNPAGYESWKQSF